MSVTANWHLGDLDQDDSDPMQAIQQMTTMIEKAEVIDLSKGVAELHADVDRLLAREGRFASSGLECPLKWTEGHYLMGGSEISCHTCPHRRDDPDDAITALCRLGLQQEKTLAQVAGAREAEGMDTELLEAMERDMDDAEELAEYALAAA